MTVELGIDEDIHEIRPGNTVWQVHRTIAADTRTVLSPRPPVPFLAL